MFFHCFKLPSPRDNRASDQLERHVQYDPGDQEVHGHLPPSRRPEDVWARLPRYREANPLQPRLREEGHQASQVHEGRKGRKHGETLVSFAEGKNKNGWTKSDLIYEFKFKTTVMHQVMETKNYGDYWKNDNLPNCFIDSVQRLINGLKSGIISDIFFPEVKKLNGNQERLLLIIGEPSPENQKP